MTYPHRQRANGFPLCACGAVPDNGPTSTWGADCPVAMREHIATLTTTLRDLRAQLDYIAHVGWDASCEAAAADALEAEDATRLNRYAVRVARERDEARAQLATTRRTLSAIDCRYTGGGVADVSGSHCPLGAPCERCAGERERDEARRGAFAYAATYIEGASIPLPLSAWNGTRKELVATFALKLAGEVRNLRGEPRMSGGDNSPTVAVPHPAEAILPLSDAASRYSAASDAGVARESEPARVDDVEGDL